jgi:hypothetical protein
VLVTSSSDAVSAPAPRREQDRASLRTAPSAGQGKREAPPVTGERGTSRPVPPPAGVPRRRLARLEEAVADLRTARNGLLGVIDPRETRAYLEAMRSCVTDIAETAGDGIGITPPAAGGPGEAAAAESDVLAACGRALSAVDQLLLGIAEARRQSSRSFIQAGEAFAASQAMVRLLLADRAAVDDSSRELLHATAGYLRQQQEEG